MSDLDRIHTIRVEAIPNGRETDYLATCSCGWEHLPVSDLMTAAGTMCAVLQAEREGAQRRRNRLARQEQEIHPRDRRLRA